jgi:hypothetical protein
VRGTDRRRGGQRLIKLTLARALKDSGNLGEQVGPIPANSRGAATAAASSSLLSSSHRARRRASPQISAMSR